MHGRGVCDSPCRGDSSLTCGGTFAFEIYPFPASAAPTPAPTTAAPTHAPTPLTGGAAIALANMSYQDLLTAARDGGEFDLVVRDAVTNEIVGTVVVTVTMARRRQMMEAIDGQQGLRGDSRDLQTSSTVSMFPEPTSCSEKGHGSMVEISYVGWPTPHECTNTAYLNHRETRDLCLREDATRTTLNTEPATVYLQHFDTFTRRRACPPSPADDTILISVDPCIGLMLLCPLGADT